MVAAEGGHARADLVTAHQPDPLQTLIGALADSVCSSALR
jgi:hypothetical protein